MMSKKHKTIFLNQKGQVLTEYLIIVVLLVFLILGHVTLCIGFISKSLMEYGTYMAARSELVNKGTSHIYAQNMIETLSPMAAAQAPQQGSYVVGTNPSKVEISYDVLASVPLFEGLVNALQNMKSSSPVIEQPITPRPKTGLVFDNE